MTGVVTMAAVALCGATVAADPMLLVLAASVFFFWIGGSLLLRVYVNHRIDQAGR